VRRRPGRSIVGHRIEGWRRFIPAALLPAEWLLPPALILSGFGESAVECPAVQVAGFAVAVAGAVLIVWAAVALGRLLVHAAAVLPDHGLVTSGPYRLVRHPVYTGYLALLLGTAVGTLNVGLLLLWPVSLVGILIQAGSEERLLVAHFGDEYRRYAGRTGRLVPRP
jgi:protein-S-isoprenylcysteine O-methyltransferase Ste14